MVALRNPYAEWRLLGPENATAMMRGHDRVLIHTMVGYLASTDTYFRSSNGYQYSGSESTYGLGGKWGSDVGGNLDGKLWCWTPRDREADCQIEGDYNSISFECADDGTNDVKPFTDKQLDTLIKAITWECSVAAHAQCPTSWKCHGVGIPAVEIPDSKAGHRGIGWHRKGVNSSPLYRTGYRQPGGELWSSSTGKICPSDIRILPIRTIIIPAVAKNLSGASIQEDELSAEQYEQIRKDLGYQNGLIRDVARQVHAMQISRESQGRKPATLHDTLAWSDANLDKVLGKLNELGTAVAALQTAVAAPDPQ